MAPGFGGPVPYATRDEYVLAQLKLISKAPVHGADPSVRLNAGQAIGILANAINESFWGQRYRGNNIGGVKINRARVQAHPETRWWWARGNVRSGDPEIVFYVAFPSLEAFYEHWINQFVPHPGVTAHQYYDPVGELFWNDEPWFDAMIGLNYKGRMTRDIPARRQAANAEHRSICRTCAQIVLNHAGSSGYDKLQSAFERLVAE